jgi:multiple sugar transport system substrate-binding protein
MDHLARPRGKHLRTFPVLPALVSSALLVATGCARNKGQETAATVITVSGSAVGREGDVLRAQLARFMKLHPEIRVVQRQTPDAADQRHQLYVQWLNAGVSEPDVLQLDVIWLAEFAAAGWIRPLDNYGTDMTAFFPATREAAMWKGKLYALPWFADVGMLYWRTDLLAHAPATLAELVAQAQASQAQAGIADGFVWQGARYEGLVCVFLEHLGAFGGQLLDDAGNVAVDSEAAARALTFMRDCISRQAIVPRSVLTWQEEQVRYDFQNGRAVFMRNWPYAYAMMQDPAQSRVAGRFAVAPMPATPAGHPTAALGGAQLAINARSKHPDAAFTVIRFLTQPEQMLERARLIGQFPARQALYQGRDLEQALAIPAAQACEIIAHAVPRPVTPAYAELSALLQIQLHRALTGQSEPAVALREAAAQMRTLLKRFAAQRESGHAPIR